MLTDADVGRIVESTGLQARSFVRFFNEQELHMPRHHPFWIQFSSRRAAMALRWGRDRCVFLDRNDQCQVYGERPLACREHPFTIKISETGAVEGIKLSKIVDCLYELDGDLTRRQLARVSRWNERESEDYQAQVKAWNRQGRGPRTRARFMEFLGLDWNAGRSSMDSPRPRVAESNPFG